MAIGLPFRGKIGVVELVEPILGGRRTANHVGLFNSLKENRRIKAVIINIDSPGGLATASASLHLAVSSLSSKKPVIAFISGAGTSGAYMVSCAATKTVAMPSAIVGSIGVMSIRPVLEKLLQKIGIHITVTKSGRLKDMGAFYRDLTEEEKKKEQELIDSFHRYFVEVVVRSRHLDEETMGRLATGEVFFAEKAKDLGLVDEIGDFEVALDLASQLGKVPRRIMYARPPQTLIQRVLSRTVSSVAEEVFYEAESILHGRYII